MGNHPRRRRRYYARTTTTYVQPTAYGQQRTTYTYTYSPAAYPTGAPAPAPVPARPPYRNPWLIGLTALFIFGLFVKFWFIAIPLTVLVGGLLIVGKRRYERQQAALELAARADAENEAWLRGQS